MYRRSPMLASLALTAALAPMAGCLRVVSQAYHEVRGARAEVKLISEIEAGVLAEYRGLSFEPCTSTVGDKLAPPELREAYDRSIRSLAPDLSETFPGGEPALRVASEILYFQKKGLLSEAECLTRVHIRSAEDLVIDAILRAESKSFREGGESALAEASVKALGKFLREQKSPEPGGEPD